MKLYSERVKNFIEEHAPQRIVLTVDEVRQMAAAAGFQVVKSPDGLEITSWGELSDRPRRIKVSRGWGPFRWERWEDHPTEMERYFFKWSTQGVTVTWFETVSDDGLSIKYIPLLLGLRGEGSFGDAPSVSDKLKEMVGVKPIAVSTPEPIVRLPREPWRDVGGYLDSNSFYDETVVCFGAEVPAHVDPFIGELQELKAKFI